MKAASIAEIKKELSTRSPKEVLELCLRLGKFKKENKELLTYLLYEAQDESSYITSVKNEIEELFLGMNRTRIFFVKKTLRKILRMIAKYARYSKKKTTHVELLLFFCQSLKKHKIPYRRYLVLNNMYERQIVKIKKIVATLHEDLQYDYMEELHQLGA